MDTAREYRQRAAVCLRLANDASEVYVKIALAELAGELSEMADNVETCGIRVPKRWAVMTSLGSSVAAMPSHRTRRVPILVNQIMP
jgi:hypothetical protein